MNRRFGRRSGGLLPHTTARRAANGSELAMIREQIRVARKLLGWEPFQLAQRAKLHSAVVVQRAESGAPPITKYQEALIRSALEAAGVEFTNGNEPVECSWRERCSSMSNVVGSSDARMNRCDQGQQLGGRLSPRNERPVYSSIKWLRR